jgi:hypothetical protein
VFHPIYIIAFGIVFARVGAAALGPRQRTIHRHRRLGDKIIIFQGFDEIGIPDQRSVADLYVVASFPDLLDPL